jgi:paraquat-inducible protein B
MAEGSDTHEARPEVPQAVLSEGRGVSLIWLIPLVAVVIGGWIAFRSLSERGPMVTIEFESAEGLEAGKTKVSYKDLQVGQVKTINLSDDLSHVVVAAELVPGAENYLTENTRFWVVRPQVTAGRITGLSTLLSGSYIAIDPVREGEPQEYFVGLEAPPVVTTSAAGRVFVLRSTELGSIEVGAPIYYRQIQVGEVASFEMDASGEFITTQVFIRKPHDARIKSNTRFWNASGIDFTIDANGIRVEAASVVSILIGGIEFDSLDPTDPGVEVDEHSEFILFKNKRDSEQPVYTVRTRYLLQFPHSVKGLVPGSPVVFRGIRIGRVVEVKLELDVSNYEIRVPVVIELEPQRIELSGFEGVDAQGPIERLVANGLRAQLGRGNLLTGALEVEFDLHPSAAPDRILLGGRYPELPTIAAPLAEITASVSSVLAKIERMPLERIGTGLQSVLEELRAVLRETNLVASGLNENVMPSLDQTLKRLDATIGSLDRLVGQDAPLPIELRKALEDVGGAARSVRVLADYLEQHPESLLRGKP